jgi:hypothetical protein
MAKIDYTKTRHSNQPQYKDAYDKNKNILPASEVVRILKSQRFISRKNWKEIYRRNKI